MPQAVPRDRAARAPPKAAGARPRSGSCTTAAAASPPRGGAAAPPAGMRAENKRLADENARLRGALEDLGAQKQRLETALEECMDLLLQVSARGGAPNANPAPNPLNDSAAEAAPVADWEKLLREEREARREEVARLRADLGAMQEGYESAVNDLRVVVAREQHGREVIDDLRRHMEGLQTSSEQQTEACERAAEDIDNLHKNLTEAVGREKELKSKLAARDDGIVEARLAAAQATAALTDEREKHCQTKLRLNALSQQAEPIASLAADTQRIKGQLNSRRSASNPPWSLSPSPDLASPPSVAKPIAFSTPGSAASPPQAQLTQPGAAAHQGASPHPRPWAMAGWSGMHPPVEAI
eukprot:TRINITY_DN30784_c0_g1_i1.p1 TRINITY_DN30784_c0_g1~~TRINITY_DN30784_c0_g1_i1.p1  ORF type:complete len:355 (+),score=125.23 TRINITY_DN30784_c0_g1_i1:56-1120(+)